MSTTGGETGINLSLSASGGSEPVCGPRSRPRPVSGCYPRKGAGDQKAGVAGAWRRTSAPTPRTLWTSPPPGVSA